MEKILNGEERTRDEIAKMTAAYPLLSCWKGGQFWSGFINVYGNLLRFSLTVPNFPNVKGIKLEGNEETRQICSQILKSDVSKIFDGESVLSDFVSKLVGLLATKCQLPECPMLGISARSPDFYMVLLDEFEQIGVTNVSYISDDYSEIHICHVDSSGRKHSVNFHLAHSYPYAAMKVNAELPVDDLKWPNKIAESNELFKEEMGKYVNFWNEMDVIDAHTRVIDPRYPSRSHKYRRILIDEKVVLHLSMNPLTPKVFPDVHLTGPEKVVDQLNRLIGKDFAKWNDKRSVLNNLEDIMQLQFLPKLAKGDSEDEKDVELKCTICYMYDLNGETPERSCLCLASFHNRCLYDLYVSEFAGCGKKFVECPLCSADLNIIMTYND